MIDLNELNRLLALGSAEFVEQVYKQILLREADAGGKDAFAKAINNGAMTKQNVIFDLRISEEGRIKGVEIKDFKINSIGLPDLVHMPDDCAFVEAAYLAVIGRTADAEGRDHHVKCLRNGTLDRLDVIMAFANTDEAKKTGTDIKGLKKTSSKRRFKNKVFRIPGIGRLAKWLWKVALINRTVNEVKGAAEQRAAATEVRVDSAEWRLNETERRLNEALEQIAEFNTKYNLQEIQNGKLAKVTTGVTYKNYEDQMRGSREDIIERLKIYDAVFRKVKENNGPKINTLDLGCGRGEWLELAKNEYGVYGLGVDSDESMLEDCKKLNINAVHADLVPFIKNAASNSVDIIVMFQVVEHLPVSVLVDVLNECQRVLRKGGALILETPNPENMIIGSCNFFLDPTHVNKLPPNLLKIFVESTGLNDTEVVRLHEYGAISVDSAKDSEATKQMAQFFNNYADYAVIAYKEV